MKYYATLDDKNIIIGVYRSIIETQDCEITVDLFNSYKQPCYLMLNDQGEPYFGEIVEYSNLSPTEGIYIAEMIPEPTQLDKVEAQSTYTAMMTDTLLIEEVATLDLHSPWYDKILLWYQQNLWTITMLKEAVEKNLIAQDEADEIINSK